MSEFFDNENENKEQQFSDLKPTEKVEGQMSLEDFVDSQKPNVPEEQKHVPTVEEIEKAPKKEFLGGIADDVKSKVMVNGETENLNENVASSSEDDEITQKIKVNTEALKKFIEKQKELKAHELKAATLQNSENTESDSKASDETDDISKNLSDADEVENMATIENVENDDEEETEGSFEVKKIDKELNNKDSAARKILDLKNRTSSDSDDNGGDSLIYRTLEEVMHESMMPYTEHVILDRALPRVEDGLKPVQRRILYSMYELGLTPDKPFRKSAKIVGDCLGKYHPHGDTSVYDAMVRLAQDFNMRNCLVWGHGNFGSVDGDPPAAMRYTEAKLSPLAVEMIKDIDENTVKFTLNFDDTCKEPETLPGHFPNLLVNGASGIAVGLATNIPPHNLGETIDAVAAYIDNKNIPLKQIMKLLKGPDFPTGGFVIAGDELEKAYETGRGKILIRAKTHIESNGDKKNIVIDELPYQVNKSKLLESIAEISEEKKTTVLGGIADIVDESDGTGMRAVIKLKKDVNPKAVLDLLFKNTNLQVSFGINMVAIADGRPQQMGILDIIAYYAEYQREVVLKRSKYRLEVAKEREHILLGLIIAIKNIDEVIKIIKKSANTTEAKAKLRTRFNLSDRQAQAILDMRLARLTSLEIEKLQKELADIQKQIKDLSAIIASKKMQYEIVKQEMFAIKRAYKSERQTEILKSADKYSVPSDDDAVVVSDCYVAVNALGNIKRISAKNYNMSVKEFNDNTNVNDVHTVISQKAATNMIALCLTNLGNAYKVDVDKIPEAKWKDKGTPIKSVIKDFAESEKIVKILTFEEELPKRILAFFTKSGMVKFSASSEYNVVKSTYQAVKLKDGDEVISIDFVDATDVLLFVSKEGNILVADKADVPLQGRVSIGVKGINMADTDECVAARLVKPTDQIVIVAASGEVKKVKLSEIGLMARYRKGLKLSCGKENIIFADVYKEQTVIAKLQDGNVLSVDGKKIPLVNRTNEGKTMFKTKKGNLISKIYNYEI